LLNLRYDEDEVRAMLVDLDDIRDTPVYRVIAEMAREEGRVVEARRLLVELGTEKLGAPDRGMVATLSRIDDITTLERLLRRLLTANTWTDLLAQEV
jgi:hypothetical protein